MVRRVFRGILLSEKIHSFRGFKQAVGLVEIVSFKIDMRMIIFHTFYDRQAGGVDQISSTVGHHRQKPMMISYYKYRL